MSGPGLSWSVHAQSIHQKISMFGSLVMSAMVPLIVVPLIVCALRLNHAAYSISARAFECSASSGSPNVWPSPIARCRSGSLHGTSFCSVSHQLGRLQRCV